MNVYPLMEGIRGFQLIDDDTGKEGRGIIGAYF